VLATLLVRVHKHFSDDLELKAGEKVQLDGSKREGDAMTFEWRQTAGGETGDGGIGVNQIVTRIVAAYVQPVAGAL
jgi:hypothetical protein